MDILNTYNPANVNITTEEIAAMQNLTPAEIEQLAKAYPNQPTGNAYLVLFDKSEPDAKKQKFPLSTWNNLHNLYKYGQNQYVAYSFKKQFQRTAVEKQAPQRTVDLSQDDLNKAEGLKSNVDATANVNSANATFDQSLAENQNQNQQQTNQEVSPELKSLYDERQKLMDEKAHHMTIKSVQTKIDALENKTV